MQESGECVQIRRDQFEDETTLERAPECLKFELVLHQVSKTIGGHIYFCCDGTEIAGFPWWDHAEKNLKAKGIKCAITPGIPSYPWEDTEESWTIYIFEHNDFIYVFEADVVAATHCDRYFKVAKDKYWAAWEALVAQYSK